MDDEFIIAAGISMFVTCFVCGYIAFKFYWQAKYSNRLLRELLLTTAAYEHRTKMPMTLDERAVMGVVADHILPTTYGPQKGEDFRR